MLFLNAAPGIILGLIALIILIVVVIRVFIFDPVRVDGPSMDTTLTNGEIIILNKFEYRKKDIERYDIVVVKITEPGTNESKKIIKRVIGLPNETISYKDDVLYIDGKAVEQDFLDETYVENEKKTYGVFTSDFGPVTLGEDEYFLMGDNRNHSTDSRSVGAFSKEDITSVGIFVYFPFSEFGGK